MIRDPHTAHTVHYLFEWSALAAGLILLRRTRREHHAGGLLATGSFAPLIGGLLGAAVGNKLAAWIDDPSLSVWQALAGQSVVGALLGGWIGVEIAKRMTGVTRRIGDDYVRPILLGLCIGRVGCFLAGLHDGTYGSPTALPWGVDHGDGVPRHPVALYESLLALAAFMAWPRWSVRWSRHPGRSFRVAMLGYLLWRLAIDTLKPTPHPAAFGMSGLQWICAVAVVVISVGLVREGGSQDHA